MAIISFIAAIFSLALAGFVLFRDWKSFVHRILAIGMAALTVEALLVGLSFQATSGPEILYWQRFRFMAAAFIPGIWLLFSMAFGRSDYREFIAKWKWLILPVFILPLSSVTIFGQAFFLGEPLQTPSADWLIRINWSGYFFHLVFLISAVLILMNLERTLRASTGRMRWQIKFVVLGVGGFFGPRIYVASQTLLFNSLDLDLLIVNMGALIIASALILKSLPRARLLNIEFYLSHSLLYNSFAVLFIGVYLIAVGVLAKLASYFDAGQSIPFRAFFIFLALLGLLVFLLSDRLRKRMKIIVSRHFKRPLYDYRKEWSGFTQQTTSVLEIKDLCAIVAKMISQTLDVLSVTIWLSDETKESLELGGSTVFSERQLTKGPHIKNDIMELIKIMRREKLPFDYDYWPENWMKEKDGSDGDLFQQARVRHCLPLMAGDKLLGVLTLGDKVGRDSFSIEDFDLLKTVADQTAASLLNLKLSGDLREMREIEAFRTMSAFLMHDLKNLASTLSLTVQNLPLHFDNPEFRNDAVRITQQSVNKINNLCAGLSSLSQKIKLEKVESDLNGLLHNTISSLNGSCQTSIRYNPQPVAKILLDPEQIQKVATNLIFNANDALKDGGEIRVGTKQEDGWIVLSVSDNGCGMSKDFIERSLFRPFKTTKKQGMGIGLFQSKMIVEAHGGRIEVESEEGRGTTFRVLLPIYAPAKE